jgi:hypothetical protein
MLGEKDKAFELLDLGLKQRATGMMMIRWDPSFDPLRSDPRFQSLCRKLGFPRCAFVALASSRRFSLLHRPAAVIPPVPSAAEGNPVTPSANGGARCLRPG